LQYVYTLLQLNMSKAALEGVMTSLERLRPDLHKATLGCEAMLATLQSMQSTEVHTVKEMKGAIEAYAAKISKRNAHSSTLKELQGDIHYAELQRRLRCVREEFLTSMGICSLDPKMQRQLWWVRCSVCFCSLQIKELEVMKREVFRHEALPPSEKAAAVRATMKITMEAVRRLAAESEVFEVLTHEEFEHVEKHGRPQARQYQEMPPLLENAVWSLQAKLKLFSGMKRRIAAIEKNRGMEKKLEAAAAAVAEDDDDQLEVVDADEGEAAAAEPPCKVMRLSQ
jgi:hypothetical protein